MYKVQHCRPSTQTAGPITRPNGGHLKPLHVLTANTWDEPEMRETMHPDGTSRVTAPLITGLYTRIRGRQTFLQGIYDTGLVGTCATHRTIRHVSILPEVQRLETQEVTQDDDRFPGVFLGNHSSSSTESPP